MMDATVFWGLSAAGVLAEVVRLAPGRFGTTQAVFDELARNLGERTFLSDALGAIEREEVLIVDPLSYREIGLALDLRKLWQCSPRDRDNFGEAEVIAVAAERSLGAILDDRRARRTAAMRFPQIEVLDTPQLLLYLVEAERMSMDEAWVHLGIMSSIGGFGHAFNGRQKTEWLSRRDYARMPAL